MYAAPAHTFMRAQHRFRRVCPPPAALPQQTPSHSHCSHNPSSHTIRRCFPHFVGHNIRSWPFPLLHFLTPTAGGDRGGRASVHLRGAAALWPRFHPAHHHSWTLQRAHHRPSRDGGPGCFPNVGITRAIGGMAFHGGAQPAPAPAPAPSRRHMSTRTQL